MATNLTSPTLAGRGFAAPPKKVVAVGGGMAEAPDIDRIYAGMIILGQTCTEAVSKALQHYRGDAAWTIGALPASEAMGEQLEAQARSLLTNSQLTMRQIEDMANQLKTVTDLRTVGRCARQVTQLSWLFRQDTTASQAIGLVCRVAEPTLAVSMAVSNALSNADHHELLNAALLYRPVDIQREECENYLRSDVAYSTFSPAVLRMTRSAVWFMALAGECMARAAARTANG